MMEERKRGREEEGRQAGRDRGKEKEMQKQKTILAISPPFFISC